MTEATVQREGVAIRDDNLKSYVDWPAIFAGTALGSAISLLLMTFGSALGLAMTSAYTGSGISLAAFAISTALWLVWVQVSGFFAGGYLTGRLRRRIHDATEHESDVRDGAHGLVVWSLGLLIGAGVAFAGLTTAASTVTSAASNIVGSAATGMSTGLAAGNGVTDDVMGLTIDRFLRPASSEGAASGQTAAAAPAGEDTGRARAESRAEILRILAPAVVAGELDAADRSYLVEFVARESRLTRDEAAARVDQLWTQATAAEKKIRDTADRARKLSVLTAFITAVSLLISGVAAYAGAVLGGNHRDNQHVVPGWTARWTR